MNEHTITVRELADTFTDFTDQGGLVFDAEADRRIDLVSEPEPGVVAVRWDGGPDGRRLDQHDRIRVRTT